jgi:hypothetical protein
VKTGYRTRTERGVVIFFLVLTRTAALGYKSGCDQVPTRAKREGGARPPLPRNCVGGQALQYSPLSEMFRTGRRGARMIPEPGDLPDRFPERGPGARRYAATGRDTSRDRQSIRALAGCPGTEPLARIARGVARAGGAGHGAGRPDRRSHPHLPGAGRNSRAAAGWSRRAAGSGRARAGGASAERAGTGVAAPTRTAATPCSPSGARPYRHGGAGSPATAAGGGACVRV